MRESLKHTAKRFLLLFLGVYFVLAAVPACVYWASTATDDEPDTPPDFLNSFAPESSSTADVKSSTFTLVDEADGSEFNLTADELIPTAVACEMDLSSPAEALKAQAVACYTLFCRKQSLGEKITCNTDKREVYTTDEILQERWGESFDENMALLRDVWAQVQGQAMMWQGQPILAVYSAVSCGATETGENVWGEDLPYLQAAASPGDTFCSGFLSTVTLSAEQVKAALEKTENPPALYGEEEDWFGDIERTPSGYVKNITVCGTMYSGSELRTAFGLRSACFTVDFTESGFVFAVRGWGHGVGLSQAGAAFMAANGADYREILSHYYHGAALETYLL